MTTSAQKQPQLNVSQIFTSQVNLAAPAPTSYEASKIHVSDNFAEERDKLQAFLAKLKLYIEFNEKKFPRDLEKTLFTTTYLKNAVFDWVNLHLQGFMGMFDEKKAEDEDTIFTSFSHYKLALQ